MPSCDTHLMQSSLHHSIQTRYLFTVVELAVCCYIFSIQRYLTDIIDAGIFMTFLDNLSVRYKFQSLFNFKMQHEMQKEDKVKCIWYFVVAAKGRE